MKRKLIIYMVLIICVIIIIAFLIIKRTEKIDINEMDISKINLNILSNSQLANLFYDMPKNSGIVDSKIESYKYPYKSASSLKDALEKVADIGKSDNTEIIKNELVEETDYYYAIYHEYVSHRQMRGDLVFKDTYLFFKESVLDIDNKVIDINIINNKDKIKEFLNIYEYISQVENGSYKMLQPDIKENKNQYEYSCYYFYVGFGDYGLKDNIILYKKTITIDKTTGKYEIRERKIREVEGKINEGPMVQLNLDAI